jgi:hypothetical protein
MPLQQATHQSTVIFQYVVLVGCADLHVCHQVFTNGMGQMVGADRCMGLVTSVLAGQT